MHDAVELDQLFTDDAACSEAVGRKRQVGARRIDRSPRVYTQRRCRSTNKYPHDARCELTTNYNRNWFTAK